MRELLIKMENDVNCSTKTNRSARQRACFSKIQFSCVSKFKLMLQCKCAADDWKAIFRRANKLPQNHINVPLESDLSHCFWHTQSLFSAECSVMFEPSDRGNHTRTWFGPKLMVHDFFHESSSEIISRLINEEMRFNWTAIKIIPFAGIQPEIFQYHSL